jgi:hypothetical protein
MAHFAQIDNDNIVRSVLVVSDNDAVSGHDFLTGVLGLTGTWLQTSYNTRAGVHNKGGTPLRKNYAGIGYTYDSGIDAFIPPKPLQNPSWIVDESTGTWNPPIEYPSDGYITTTLGLTGARIYSWDEPTTSWVPITSVPALSSSYVRMTTPYPSTGYGIGTLLSARNYGWDNINLTWSPMSALPGLSAFYFKTLSANS